MEAPITNSNSNIDTEAVVVVVDGEREGDRQIDRQIDDKQIDRVIDRRSYKEVIDALTSEDPSRLVIDR